MLSVYPPPGPDDVVTIDIPGIGALTNPVVLVGRYLDQE
jgi:hypothetical protein